MKAAKFPSLFRNRNASLKPAPRQSEKIAVLVPVNHKNKCRCAGDMFTFLEDAHLGHKSFSEGDVVVMLSSNDSGHTFLSNGQIIKVSPGSFRITLQDDTDKKR
jgi:hypothetical protein